MGVCIPYEIDTKYYTAKVDFWMDEIDAVSEKETIKAYCEKEGDISRVIDAFVFLFDKDKVDMLFPVLLSNYLFFLHSLIVLIHCHFGNHFWNSQILLSASV